MPGETLDQLAMVAGIRCLTCTILLSGMLKGECNES
jgi:hypothetical protein